MSTDFIPRQDAAFDAFLKNIVDYVINNCARWEHIPQDFVNELQEQFANKWTASYHETLVPHLPQLTKEKNRVRTETERFLRAFINRFLRWPPVTDLDRDKMGIRNWATSRAPQPVPSTLPELEINTSVLRQIGLRMRDHGATTWGKPDNVHHIQITWDILDSQPTSISSFSHFEVETANPITLLFEEHERGKRIYFAARWVNNTAKEGPWNEIGSAIIP